MLIVLAPAVALAAAACHGAVVAGAARRARRRLGCPPSTRRPPPLLERALDDADLPVPADRAVIGWMAGVASACAAGAAAGGPAAGVVLGIASASGPVAVLHALRDRADRRLERELPAALELVARSLRAGGTLRDALRETAAATTGRLGTDLQAVVASADAGTPLVAALDDWPRRRPCRGVRLAVAALALGASSGGATARAVDGVAGTLRAAEAVAAEARSLAAQARLSALVIALAPIAFALLASAADARTAEFLLRTPVGLACLVAGLALDLVAGVWMHRLTAALA